jgi:uncharacterized membrane protein HdeD (DUF308 family)
MLNDTNATGLDDLRKNWFGFVAVGILLIVLGLIAMGSTFLFTQFVVDVTGWILIFSGVSTAIHGFWRRRWSGFFLDLLCGLLYLAVGFMFVVHTLEAAQTLTLLIAISLVVGGLFRIVAAATGHFQNWPWVLLHGLVSLALGVSIWRQWPASGEWVIGLFVAIDLLMNGWTLVMLGVASRRLIPPPTTA